MPSRVLNFQTPCQVLLQSFPNTRILSTLPMKVFGCSVFVHIHAQHRSKLDPKALKCIFVEYSSNQKGYKCYSPVTHRFYNSMDVSFFEQQLYHKAHIQGENFTQEYQLWDIDTLDSSNSLNPNPTELPQPSQTDPSLAPSI